MAAADDGDAEGNGDGGGGGGGGGEGGGGDDEWTTAQRLAGMERGDGVVHAALLLMREVEKNFHVDPANPDDIPLLGKLKKEGDVTTFALTFAADLGARGLRRALSAFEAEA